MSAKAKRPRSSPANEKTVIMPPESYGLCRIGTCHVIGDLGVGLCVEHWDAGLDKRTRKSVDG